MTLSGSVLKTIIARKRQEVAALTGPGRAADLRRAALDRPPGRDLERALRACAQVPVVAEIKRASPSAGRLGNGFQAADLARTYEANGAAALSVLTDRPFFEGCLADLKEARQAVGLPVLRKDFLFDPYHLFEARAYGADAVLLIAAVLDPGLLAELLALARTLGLEGLVEVHDEQELERALAAEAAIIGVNNRDLRTFEVDLAVTERLRSLIPADRVVVAESGIHTRADVERLRALGVHGVLIGEALVLADNPGAKIGELLGGSDLGGVRDSA